MMEPLNFILYILGAILLVVLIKWLIGSLT